MPLSRSLIVALIAVLPASMGIAGVTVTPIDTPPPSSSASTDAMPDDASPGSGLPTAEQAQRLVDAGKYQEALHLLLRLLDLHGDAARFDRAKMLMLRAECQLQIHQQSYAIGTLQDAAQTAWHEGNVDDADQAMAFAYLMQKSKKDTYLPLTGANTTPINILDRKSRKDAYRAAFADHLALLQQKVRNAIAGGSIMPFMDMGHDFPVLRGLEELATGASKQSDQFAKETARSAAKLINTALTADDNKINSIANAANQMVTDGTSQYGRHYHFVGLTNEQKGMLDSIAENCRKISTTISDLSRVFADASAFGQLGSHAQATAHRANQVRTRNYGSP